MRGSSRPAKTTLLPLPSSVVRRTLKAVLPAPLRRFIERDRKFSRDLAFLVRDELAGRSGETVLDVGCGDGRHTAFFLGNENVVHGLDIHDHQPPRSQQFHFQLYAGQAFPYPDALFDLVASFDVIEHVEDDQGIVAEIWRVLKPGGRILCGTPNRLRLGNLLRSWGGLRPIRYPWHLDTHLTLGEIVHVREYTASELAALFLDRGFSGVRVRPFWFGFRMGGIEWLSVRHLPLFRDYAHYLFLTARKLI